MALNSLYAQSSSGSLQHAALPRIRNVLEARGESLWNGGNTGETGHFGRKS